MWKGGLCSPKPPLLGILVSFLKPISFSQGNPKRNPQTLFFYRENMFCFAPDFEPQQKRKPKTKKQQTKYMKGIVRNLRQNKPR